MEVINKENRKLRLEQENETEVLEKRHTKEIADLEEMIVMEREKLKRAHDSEKDTLVKKHKGKMHLHHERMAEVQAKLQAPEGPNTQLAPVCPVCLQAMIYTCYNGHLVCESCKNKVTTCSLCSQPIMGRAAAMEQMLRNIFKIN